MGGLAALVGLINVGSALTPDLSTRAHLLVHLAPYKGVLAAHALALPAGVMLLMVAFYLGHRRRHAWRLALWLLVVVGALNILKGLDVEEAAISWALAALLYWGRDTFNVKHEDHTLRTAAEYLPLPIAAAFVTAVLAVWAGSGSAVAHVNWWMEIREAAAMLTLTRGPVAFSGAFHWLPVGVGLIGIGLILTAGYLIFRPLAAPRDLPNTDERQLAIELVHRYGDDTLSFFKLREDQQYLFSNDSRAFLAYRIEGGVMLMAGDPIGPAESVPDLMHKLCSYANSHGLRIGILGASDKLAGVCEKAGLRSIYIGDEAIVDIPSFTLEGRKIRKVRQSVSRLTKAGYTAKLSYLGDLGEDGVDYLEAIAEEWREGEPERGFSMAMDSLYGAYQADTAVVVAYDSKGKIRGYLHFVPSYNHPAMSLSMMRRDRKTPNGLTEFLVCKSIELLEERGTKELSLNFAAFSRVLRDPEGIRDAVLGSVLAVASRYAQIESLYKFNAKFFPRWNPRYLLYESRLGLPRTGLAAMWAEGVIFKPSSKVAPSP